MKVLAICRGMAYLLTPLPVLAYLDSTEEQSAACTGDKNKMWIAGQLPRN
jgi:hypothetical protein